MPIRRRDALALPALLLPALPARARNRVPPFPEWVGRTARLKGDNGEARLRLDGDRTGLLSVRLLFLCRPLPVLEWRIADDGRSLTYRRQSAVSASRIIDGVARIADDAEALHWIEAQNHLAVFEGFEAPEAVRVCG